MPLDTVSTSVRDELRRLNEEIAAAQQAVDRLERPAAEVQIARLRTDQVCNNTGCLFRSNVITDSGRR